MQAVLVALQQQLLAAQPTTLASVCEEADTQLEERTGAPELADGIGQARVLAAGNFSSICNFREVILGMSTLFKHLFKRHKYLLFIDQFIVDIYRVNILKKKQQMGRKLLHCNQLILGYTSVQQLHKKHYGSTTYLGGRRRRH